MTGADLGAGLETFASGLVDAIVNLIAGVHPLVLALILVGGPTALLFAYRWVAGLRSRHWANGGEELYWRCAGCNSMNRDGDELCYRCHAERGLGVPVVPEEEAAAPVPVMAEHDERVGVPVMAQRDEGVGVPVMVEPTEKIGDEVGPPVAAPASSSRRTRRPPRPTIAPGEPGPSDAPTSRPSGVARQRRTPGPERGSPTTIDEEAAER